jgi:glycosyltransferase involved in cell wall biosynthesis
VQIACCGLFHFRNYVSTLAAEGLLKNFYFSHKTSTFHGEEWAQNYWAKEYLLKILQGFLSDQVSNQALPLLHDCWDRQVSRRFLPTRITHVMLHGTALRTIRKARAAGSVVIGEAVNTHPENLHSITLAEEEACGLRVSGDKSLPVPLEKLKTEVSLCDWLLVPSPCVRDTFTVRGFPAERIILIPFGANTEIFRPPVSPAARREGPLRVLCVAQVAPRKGIHYLLDAWRKAGFSQQTATLRIVGRIPKEMYFLTQTDIPGVVFVGTLPRHEVAREMAQASVFVLPTTEEGFAVSILEAMSAGCAVVTTPESGAEAVITDDQNGLIVAARNPAAMAAAFCRLSADRHKCERLGQAAIETVKQGNTWIDYLGRLKSAYSRVLAQ